MFRRAFPIVLSACFVGTVFISSPSGAQRGGRTVVIAAAGDIACDPDSPYFKNGRGTRRKCRQKDVSDLIVGHGYDGVLALGDNQYQHGEYKEYLRSYDRSWGRFKRKTHPVPGNHEYTNPSHFGSAPGYFKYFGKKAGRSPGGYYSFDIGAWHVIAMNSNCTYIDEGNGCERGSDQELWLRKDLRDHKAKCTLAFWHAPRFTSAHSEGAHTSDKFHRAFWNDLYRNGADVILNGHAHHYERFAPLTPDGKVDQDRGITEFVVGTGGKENDSFGKILRTSRSHKRVFGILELTLKPSSFEWRYRTIPKQRLAGFKDSGERSCH